MEKYTKQFASGEFVTLGDCAQITTDDLARMGITEAYTFEDEAKRLRGKSEAEVVQELPVSVLRTESTISFSSS